MNELLFTMAVLAALGVSAGFLMFRQARLQPIRVEARRNNRRRSR